jgi:hypothetical protein
MGFGAGRRDPALGDVLKAALGLGGMAMCLTLMFLGMRAVMDIGGACADGGPYVSAHPCPDGTSAALMLGMLGLFLFGWISMVYGGRLGGIWGSVPLLAWTGLFGSLGWNFLDYGLFNPPLEADGIIWGWVICGATFEVMAFAPLLLLLIPGVRGTQRGGARPPVMIRPRPMGRAGLPQATRLVPPPGFDAKSFPASSVARSSASHSSVAAAERAALRDIAAAMGAVVTEAAATTPADPAARAASGRGHESAPEAAPFSEGTQALLDRLERFGDMRDRGLLTADEFEAAKAAIIAELETRA